MKKVLIIEDERSIADVEKDYLEANNYTVEIERTGSAGLKSALEKEHDLILLDIMLPDLDGFSICKEIRKVKQTPILFVTAKLDDIDKIKGFGAGADDYMIKPFSFQELVVRVGAHIARYEKLTNLRMKPSEIMIKDLQINLSSRQVFLNGNELLLPNREFELLSFFTQHPDEVFSKETLLNKVWGADAYVELNTVTVHVNRLREKIEKDVSNPSYIKTVWGVGYKFNVLT
jgi:DNA-binding response OmpR family regulator